ncbi:MAG: hypothetical protein IT276_16585 [Ignavibacteriaceae bacterium]|nr:hypothetical protein [Ignavibacteriaceae bacterium]HRP93748.1 D-glucuronyl C5-epimerase family protein [Ignavibacteriaceae bacterium]
MTFKDLKNYYNKVLVFYSPERAGYWNSITPCAIFEKPNKLGRYYLDFRSKIFYPGTFSKDGIPLFSHQGKDLIIHPTVVIQYAFGIYDNLYQGNFGDAELKGKFLKMAKWLETSSVDVKGGKGWFINIEYNPEYKLDNSWISAITQGQAISVLTRASLLDITRNYEQLAEDALGPLKFEVKDGGLINFFNSIPVFEECPTPHKPMVVLNGFIFALFGLYDLILLNGSETAKQLFAQGIDSLNKILPFFDINNWTQYYLFDYPHKYYSSFTYHILVTEQLKALYYLTGDINFLKYHEKWNGYSKSYINRTRALIKKVTSSNKFGI